MSTIIISKSEKLSLIISRLSKTLFKFGGKNSPSRLEHKGHIVLFGGDRTGRSLLSFLKKTGETIVVIDFNPQVVAELNDRGESVIFADAADPEILDLANISQAKMIISTIKNVNDSLALLAELKNNKIEVPVVVDAESFTQAKELYEAGAAYVIFPHFVTGWHMGQMIKKFKKDKHALEKYRMKQGSVLKSTYEGED